ncbi:hypothetical protein [Gynuella sp.]|uniref:hypothetical protein n=1 Tax=Gynuella sp. TaxID=2969146 RepID=UPI003D0A9A34
MTFDYLHILTVIKHCHETDPVLHQRQSLTEWSKIAALACLQAQGLAISAAVIDQLNHRFNLVLEITARLNQIESNQPYCDELMQTFRQYYRWLGRQGEGLSALEIQQNWENWLPEPDPKELFCGHSAALGDDNNDCMHDNSDFLTLNGCIDDIAIFARQNSYQDPLPDDAFIDQWLHATKKLCLLAERLKVPLPLKLKTMLQQVAALYPVVTGGTTNLFIAAPDPDAAKHWFDYQQEYHARHNQKLNLERIMDWSEHLYRHLLHRVPVLPIPWPVHDHDSIDQDFPEDNQSPIMFL